MTDGGEQGGAERLPSACSLAGRPCAEGAGGPGRLRPGAVQDDSGLGGQPPPGRARAQVCLRHGVRAAAFRKVGDHRPRRRHRRPTDLGQALTPSSPDEQLTDILGKSFVDAFLTFKRNELTRFHKHLTDWQFRAYAQIN